MIDLFTIQRLWLQDFPGAWVSNITRRANHHNRLASEQSEFFAVLVADSGKECGERVVVRLAVFFKRMMVTLGTLQTGAQKQLGC